MPMRNEQIEPLVCAVVTSAFPTTIAVILSCVGSIGGRSGTTSVSWPPADKPHTLTDSGVVETTSEPPACATTLPVVPLHALRLWPRCSARARASRQTSPSVCDHALARSRIALRTSRTHQKCGCGIDRSGVRAGAARRGAAWRRWRRHEVNGYRGRKQAHGEQWGWTHN